MVPIGKLGEDLRPKHEENDNRLIEYSSDEAEEITDLVLAHHEDDELCQGRRLGRALQEVLRSKWGDWETRGNCPAGDQKAQLLRQDQTYKPGWSTFPHA